MRRHLRHLPLLALIVLAVIYRSRQVGGWVKDAARGEPERDLFLDRCAEIVPEDALIYMDAESGEPGALYAAALLYPRRMIPCRADEIPDEARSREDTWVIVFPEPFDASKAVVEKLRAVP